MRKTSKAKGSEAQLALYDKRTKLQKEIDQFHQSSLLYLPPLDPATITHKDPNDWVDEEEENEGDPTKDIPGSYGDKQGEIIDIGDNSLLAEQQILRLPSSFGRELCTGRLKELAKIELDLRKGQANDALHGLRLAIGQKSFHFRANVRQASSTANTGYQGRLRSADESRSIQNTIDEFSKVYTSARNAMEIVGATGKDLRHYQKLSRQDIKTTPAVVDFNARGQRNEGLSWIWQMYVESSEDPDWMDECWSSYYHLVSVSADHLPSVSCQLAQSEVKKG